MGFLDADDSAIKDSLKYKDAVKSLAALDEAIADYKAKGATGSVAPKIAQAIYSCLRNIDRGAKQYPDFAEWAELRAKPMDVGKAMLEKHPHACGSIQEYIENPDKRFG